MDLAHAFGQSFIDNKNLIRTRSFELGGHKFKVKVPLTSEMEVIHKRVNEIDDAIVAKYYDQMTKGFFDNNGESLSVEGIELLDNDVLIQGKSVRDIAKGKATAEKRITEMLKLLVPDELSFDMDSLTYEMIEELFPFSIQIEMMEAIAKTISPDYKDQRKK